MSRIIKSDSNAHFRPVQPPNVIFHLVQWPTYTHWQYDTHTYIYTHSPTSSNTKIIFKPNYSNCRIPYSGLSLASFYHEMGWLVWCLLEASVLATSKVIWSMPSCDSVYSLWLYSAAPLEDQAASTMSWYVTQSHYPVTEPTSPCPNLIMLRVWLVSHMFKFLSHWFDSTRVWMHGLEFHDLLK